MTIVALLADADLDAAMCDAERDMYDARAEGDELAQAVVAEAVAELRRLRGVISAGAEEPWMSCGGRDVL